jgi:hypothetical protein
MTTNELTVLICLLTAGLICCMGFAASIYRAHKELRQEFDEFHIEVINKDVEFWDYLVQHTETDQKILGFISAHNEILEKYYHQITLMKRRISELEKQQKNNEKHG